MSAAYPIPPMPTFTDYVTRRTGVNTVLRYQTTDQIGEGTYGKVFKATDEATKSRVALKMMLRHHENEGFPRTETREIKLLKALSHRNMVRLHEVVTAKEHEDHIAASSHPSEDSEHGRNAANLGLTGLSDRVGNIYMAFEYVEYDLAGLIESNFRFSEAQVRSYVYQLLDVLQFIHSKGYVHRDLKCSNLLLTDDNVIKLADFGLSRALPDRRAASASSSSSYGGYGHPPLTNKVITLWYRPPELLLGSVHYDGAVDMWSVGCILFELLVNKPLFPAKDEAEQLLNHYRVVGTPGPESSLRRCPDYQPPVKEYPHRLAERMNVHPELRDATLRSLMTRLLEPDPLKRIGAAEAVRHNWFKPVDKDRPWKGLSLLSKSDHFTAEYDYHEFSTKKRRRRDREERDRDRDREATMAAAAPAPATTSGSNPSNVGPPSASHASLAPSSGPHASSSAAPPSMPPVASFLPVAPPPLPPPETIGFGDVVTKDNLPKFRQTYLEYSKNPKLSDVERAAAERLRARLIELGASAADLDAGLAAQRIDKSSR